MRPLAVLFLAGLVCGCSMALRLDLSRAGSPATAAPSGQPATAAGASSLGELLIAYRDELSRYCAGGALAEDHCAEHRRHLLDLFRATADDEQRRAADRLAEAADDCPNPTARAALGRLAGAIMRRLLNR